MTLSLWWRVERNEGAVRMASRYVVGDERARGAPQVWITQLCVSSFSASRQAKTGSEGRSVVERPHGAPSRRAVYYRDPDEAGAWGRS